jgi:hypothetical protein
MLFRMLSIAIGQLRSVRSGPERLTLVGIILRDRHIRSNCLVLSVDENPEPERVGIDLVEGGDPLLESSICLLLQHSESSEIGSGEVLVVK